MARLLFTLWPYPTHIHPFIALARELRERGHEICFYCGGEGIRLLEQQGFQCMPFRDVDWSGVARTVEDLIAGRRRPIQVSLNWARFLAATVPAQVRDLEGILARWPADAIVCDIAMWAPILVLHDRDRMPVIPFSHVANCILPGPEGPVQGLALPRRRGSLVELIAQAASQVARLVTARTRHRANTLRRSYGLPPLATGVNEFTGTMPLYLVPSSSEFDNERRDLPPSVRYVGPCLWDKPQDQPAPAWLGEIPRDRPVVLVEEGSLYTNEPRVLRMAAQALAGLPLSVQVVAGRGRQLDRLQLGPLAGNVALRPHTPLSDLLPLASVLVTNGNSESVLAALQAGVPTVVLPSIWDQAELAWRVSETGVGIRLSPWRSRPRHMRAAVERILHDPAFRERTATLQATLARCGGPAAAAQYVEEMLAGTGGDR
ncbi:MAG: hypothetical protein U0Q18_02140 [Bryobacteraceae bacterium]